MNEADPAQPDCVLKQFFPEHQGTANVKQASHLFLQKVLRLEELGQHPQIPDLLGSFEEKGYQYLVQEFIDGPDLEQELKTGEVFTEEQIWQLLDELLPVLKFVHEHLVIHRDIKPANLIRRSPLTCVEAEQQGTLYLVDLGAAKFATSTNLRRTGTVIGSAEYVAPGGLIRILSGYSGSMTALAFLPVAAPESLRLVSSSLEPPIVIWDLATPTAEPQITSLMGHRDAVHTIVASQNGNLIVSSSRDMTLHVWQRQPG